jgi:hypothetical protein
MDTHRIKHRGLRKWVQKENCDYLISAVGEELLCVCIINRMIIVRCLLRIISQPSLEMVHVDVLWVLPTKLAISSLREKLLRICVCS